MFLLPSLLFSQNPTFEYKLGMSKPSTHLLEVELSVKSLPSGSSAIDFLMPVWRTGRYVIFDFAGGVQEFSARDGSGSPLKWSKTEKSTWRVEKNRATAVTIRYKVYANEFEMRTRGLNDEHAFVDGCAVFMYIDRYRHLPLTLAVTPYQDWHVTTGLEAAPGGQFRFSAPDFDYLVDCPLEIGHQKDFEFQAEGKKHVLSIFGQGNYDADTLIKDISTIVKANKEFWGDLPYDRYVFMLHLSSRGGGTEHINSTIMQTSPYRFKNPGSYRGFLGLVSHEYFHTWNVKRLRPKGILPYDYMRENYLNELWVAEGTTSYYGELLLVRAGFIPVSGMLDGLASGVQSDRQRPGNKVQSVTESSFDAWIKLWKGNQQSYNSETDYYGKGSDVSLVLDLEIRQRSKNKYSLDDVMRTLYRRFPLSGKGYTVNDLQKIAEELAGGSLQSLFDNYVFGTTAIDWESTLRYAGLELQAKDSERKTWLGLQSSDQNGRARAWQVIAGSPAYDAGLDIGDEVLAINGRRVRSSDLQERIAEFKPGEKVKITLFRDDTLREFEVALRLQDVPPYKVVRSAQPTPLQKSIFESWLNAKWE
ncbi:MAG: peptidase protein [Bacteroidetes bacterium]|nr:peptidase protein [Bacteroidota bacterium]